MELYDAHNHLQDEWLQPHRELCFGALAKIGLCRAVVNGTEESDWRKVGELAQAHPWIVPSYGLHPWFVGRRTAAWADDLARRLDGGGMVGEIGLDRWKRPFDLADQQSVFVRQLRMATTRGLPVTIHCLQAWGALLEILRTESLPQNGFLLHAYGGPQEMVSELVKLGAYFSFNGYFLHERKAERRQTFKLIPLARLLVETDAPAMPLPREREAYSLPPSIGGDPINHPANLIAVYEGLATVREIPVDVLAGQVAENFSRLFCHSFDQSRQEARGDGQEAKSEKFQ